MPISSSFLEILRCPKTSGGLREAQSAEAAILEQKWSAKHSDSSDLDGYLVSEDGSWGYVQRNGIPCLLMDEAIALP